MSNLFRPLIVALSLLLALAFSSNAGSGMCDFSGREKLVNDFAGVFTYAQREMLECELVAFDDSTSNQICVVTVTDLEGKDVGQYALRLGNDWGIGSGKNNGVLVLLKSRTDDDPYIDVAIQVGRGLEGAIPDAYASRIIRNIMGPQLKQDRYFEAVQAACEELKALACNEISEPRDDEEDVPLGLISAFVIIGLIIIIVALYVDAKHPHDKGSSGNVGGGRRPPIIFFGGGRSSSGPSFGGMGGGGFRGFGGGSFGGGGATGRFGFIPLFLASAMLSNISCSAQVLPGDVAHERYFDGTYYHDIPNPGWETEVKARADMMLMQWTPLLDVPGSFLKPDLYFAAGETVTGIPYSSVSSYNCYMGRDVSFYTFLSSLKNPKSLMYTTDYRQPGDYSRKSCYYGSTCCNTVIYNWGI